MLRGHVAQCAAADLRVDEVEPMLAAGANADALDDSDETALTVATATYRVHIPRSRPLLSVRIGSPFEGSTEIGACILPRCNRRFTDG
jgi:hypothetical protein